MKSLVLFFLMFAALPVFARQTGELEETKKKLAEAEKKLDDWAELNRYADANAKVSAPETAIHTSIITARWLMTEALSGTASPLTVWIRINKATRS